jgi:class 3 adenylate cyclase/tetratricopeptide (TPR) repeat protein
VEQCARCGTTNAEGSRFCVECGAVLAQTCASCGQPIQAGFKFCGQCGAPLATVVEAQPLAPAQGPVAERRLCSVLFCDLVGFTPLSEARDPEEVRELLSAYFETASTVIRRYGGVVEKFIGDAVMAVWGTPTATESDAERAVRAALDLVDTVRQLGAERQVATLAARAGVVTGEVAVTIGAVNEGMVAGDAVNTAARVQAAAASGQVLVDSATRRLASGAIGFEDADLHTLKGKTEPEQLWRATRVVSGVGGWSQRVDGLEAPLTARDAEMRTIRELFHAAAERRTPRMVVLSGPAGVGKSRLGWEFRKYVDGLVDIVNWHHGRCLSYGEGVSFWALAEMMRQRLGIAEDDQPELAAIKLVQGMEQWVPDEDERAYVGTRLARLLGIPYTADTGAELSREELFAGWRIFVERLANDAPVVLMLEDAQHADRGLLDFLDHLVDWSRDLPVYVLVLTRPELDDVRPGFGTGRNRVLLTLDPLDDASMRPLVDALVPGMPVAARDAIVAQAQGVPLYAVETVRSLVDRDVVQPIDGVYRLVGDVGELVVPDSLHALLAARLDALAPDVRRLVADAAVLGTSFTADALVAVSELEAESLRDRLAELLRREVLTVSADPLSPERGSYRFAQDLLRQVAYDTLSRRDRKARHLAVAGYLRETFANDGEEVVDVLARHYLDALAAVPDDPDADALREHALAALVRAAERAARTGAPDRASRSYSQAAELLEESGGDPRRCAHLFERAITAAYDSGAANEVIDLAEANIERYTALGENRATARSRTQLGRCLVRLGRYTTARETLAQAIAGLQDPPDADTVTALEQLALLETFAGTPEADAATVAVLRLAQGLEIGPATLAGVLHVRGMHLGRADRLTEAVFHIREAVRLAEEADRPDLAGLYLGNLGSALMGYEPATAVDMTRRALDLARRGGNRRGATVCVTNLAQLLIDTGRWDEAAELLAPGGNAEVASDSGELAAWARLVLLALRGDGATARSILAQFEMLPNSDDPEDRSALAIGEALTAAAENDPDTALEHALGALSFVDALGVSHEMLRWGWPLATRIALDRRDNDTVERMLGMLPVELPRLVPPMLRAERLLVLARRAANEESDDAAAAFGSAMTAMREMSPPHLLAQGLLDHAEYLAAHGDPAGAAAAVDEARAIGERLGCRQVVARAEAAGAFNVTPMSAGGH